MVNLMRAKRLQPHKVLVDFQETNPDMFVLVEGRVRTFKTPEEFRAYRLVHNKKLRSKESSLLKSSLVPHFTNIDKSVSQPVQKS